MDEADHIAAQITDAVQGGRRRPRDFAIFYRVNALSRPLEFALRSAGIPYQMINGVEFYRRKEIKDVLGYLLLINNPRDDMAFLRVVNMPPRGIGKTTLDRVAVHATRCGKSLLDAAREAGMIAAIPKKAAVAVAKFVAMFDRLSLVSMRPVEEILGHVLDETGYQGHLVDSGLEEDQERLANIQELLTAAREFDEQTPGEGHLEEFLENVCLINDVDVWESSDDRVAMMTLHASKGLEFPCVYIVAVEEGLLPHERSQNSPDELEEERRLFFVGITRAEEELQLSVSQYREFRGRRQLTIPSKFLLELPFDEIDATEGSWSTEEVTSSEEAWDEPAHDMDEMQAHVEDAVWSPPEILDRETDGRPRGVSKIGKLRIPTVTTAAEMAATSPTGTGVSPELFHQGMVVLHPEYGLGRIIALSGSGLRRTATVSFASAGEKKFVLAQSALRPMKSNDPGS
jgi:DNA helicase-2/ATP-dependent DNA helicase PcrA